MKTWKSLHLDIDGVIDSRDDVRPGLSLTMRPIGVRAMTEITTEPGRWLLDEYRRTPGDPKWHPGMGLESTIIAIETYAAAGALRELREKIMANEDEWDTTYSAEQGVSLKKLLRAIDRRLK